MAWLRRDRRDWAGWVRVLAGALALTAGTTASLAEPEGSPAVPTTAQPAPVQPAASASPDYVRTQTDEAGVASLQVAIRSFTITDAGGRERTVHLVGAIHIGDKAYYDQLQGFLDQQDLVLYEGVKPPGSGTTGEQTLEARIASTKRRLDLLAKTLERQRAKHDRLPESFDAMQSEASGKLAQVLPGLRADAWGHPLQLQRVVEKAPEEGAPEREYAVIISPGPDGDLATAADNLRVQTKAMRVGAKVEGQDEAGLQQQLAEALGLEFQLKAINYDRKNFRVSDLSMDEIQERIEKAGGDADMLFGMLDGSSFMGKLASLAVNFIKGSPKMAAMMKLVMVQMMGEAEKMLGGEGGPAGNIPGMGNMAVVMKVILHDRNQVVLADLKKVLETEPQYTNVAAFYGAGHLPELERDLIALGAKVKGEQWLTAVSIDPKAAGLSDSDVKMVQRMIQSQMKAMEKAAERAKAKKQGQDKPAN